LHGSIGSTDIRSGGVFGDDFGIALGSLTYYASNLNDYSVYGFGGAYQVGVVGGMPIPAPLEPNTHIGLGIYGGVMGSWIRGMVYGSHFKGDRYSLYVEGKTYTTEPVAELSTNVDGTRTALYAISSTVPDVYASGRASLQSGSKYVSFDSHFLSLAKKEEIVITVSPMANSKVCI
jgi:hypothetical protein